MVHKLSLRMTLHHQEWFLLISLILAVLAVIGHFVAIPFMGEHGFWVAIIAYVVLAVGTQELFPIHSSKAAKQPVKAA
jgi:hypothetical protein